MSVLDVNKKNGNINVAHYPSEDELCKERERESFLCAIHSQCQNIVTKME